MPSILISLSLHIYRKGSVIITLVGDYVVVSHKQETIMPLISSLMNVLGGYILINEGDILNCRVLNIKNNSNVTL